MMQELVIKKRIHKLQQLQMEETLRDKKDYLFLNLLKERIKQEETKLKLLKIGKC
jgi:hypothetical protein